MSKETAIAKVVGYYSQGLLGTKEFEVELARIDYEYTERAPIIKMVKEIREELLDNPELIESILTTGNTIVLGKKIADRLANKFSVKEKK